MNGQYPRFKNSYFYEELTEHFLLTKVNEKGEVIGVSVATFIGGQNLNFAVPSMYLKQLLSKAGPLMPLARAEVKKSALADAGGRGNDSVVGENFTWDYFTQGGYSFSLHNLLRELPVVG
jgi:hypothetical protein